MKRAQKTEMYHNDVAHLNKCVRQNDKKKRIHLGEDKNNFSSELIITMNNVGNVVESQNKWINDIYNAYRMTQ